MPELLAAASPIDDLWQAALPAPTPALHVSVVDGLRILMFRHLPAGLAAVDGALAVNHLPALPAPATCVGSDPWQVWLGPSESLLLTRDDELANRLLAALSPGCHPLTCVLDQSAAWLVFELLGRGVDALLPRLFDDSAIPRQPGLGVRARFMDIRGVVMCVGSDRVLIAVDRSHGGAAARWIGQAWSAAQG